MDIKEYLRICYDVAADSPDPSNQNGAIVIDGDVVVSRGRNEFPEGVEWTPELIKDRDWKLFHIEHSERNAIYPLSKAGYRTNGLTMICPWFACGDCARAILLTGIKKVVGHKERMEMTPDRWRASVNAGLKLLEDGGVKLEFYSGKIGGNSIIVNGENWHP